MKRLTVLGSTGSIGVATLDVVRRNREGFGVYALAAGRNVSIILNQIKEFRPKVAILAEPAERDRLAAALPDSGLPRPYWPELECGPAALVAAATASEADMIISAIVGRIVLSSSSFL